MTSLSARPSGQEFSPQGQFVGYNIGTGPRHDLQVNCSFPSSSHGFLNHDLWSSLTWTQLDGNSVSRDGILMVLEETGFIFTPLMKVLGESCPSAKLAKNVFRTPSLRIVTGQHFFILFVSGCDSFPFCLLICGCISYGLFRRQKSQKFEKGKFKELFINNRGLTTTGLAEDQPISWKRECKEYSNDDYREQPLPLGQDQIGK